MSDSPKGDYPELRRVVRSESFSQILLKTALLLGAVALLALGLSWAFGRVAFENPGREELFQKIVDGRRDVRRAAALEWSRQLIGAEERGRADERQLFQPTELEAERLRLLLRTLEIDADSSYVSGLAQILSFVKAEARPASAESLCMWLEARPMDSNTESQLFVMLALGRLIAAEKRAYCPALRAREEHSDSSVRKTLAFVLGLAQKNSGLSSDRSEIVSILSRLYQSGEGDLRWNAAFALASWGSTEGLETISSLLEEALLSDREGAPVLDALRISTYESAIAAAVLLQDSDLNGKVRRIAKESGSLRLRQSAAARLRSSELLEPMQK